MNRQRFGIRSIIFSIFVFVLFSSPGFLFAQVSNQTVPTADLQSQIQALLKQIQILQQQVATLQAELGKEPEKISPAALPTQAGETFQIPLSETHVSKPEIVLPEFTRSLSRGSSGDDVRKLQEFLAQDKDIYPDALITGYFGPKTEAAVKKWQEKHGIESIGIIGPKSIAKLKDFGKVRIQQLVEQGAGQSGVVPPGLLTAPGIQKKLETATTTPPATIPVTTTTTPAVTLPVTTPVTAAQTTTVATLSSPISITSYATSNSGIASNRVTSIAVDIDGSIWVGHILGKVSRFDRANWRVYDLPLYINPKVPTNKVPPSVNAIAIDKNDNKWFATDLGLGKFDGSNWTMYSITQLPNTTSPSIISSADSFGGGYFISAAFDKSGNGWFGTNNSWLWKFDGVSWKQYAYPPYQLTGTRIYDITVGSGSNIWFSSLETIMKFDGINWFGWAVPHQGRSRNLAMYAVEIDPKGYMWFGTDQDGVRKYDENYWLPRGSDYSKLNMSFTTSNSGLAGDEIGVGDIAFQSNGTGWFGTRYGVSSFDGTNWKTYDVEKGLLSNTVTAVAVDTRDNVWVGTDYHGASLLKFEQGSATVPAVPATPAQPTSGTGTVTVPATPATPAVPAQSAATTTTATTTSSTTSSDVTPPSVTLTGPYPGLSPTCTVLYNSSYSDNVSVFGVQKKVDGVNLDPEYFPNSGPGFVGGDNGCLYLANGSHTFAMVVRDAAGNATTKSIAISIPLGPSATTTATSTTPVSDTVPPLTPTNLTATVASSTQINLTWTASTDNVRVTGYRIYRGGTQIATVITATSYSDTGLIASTVYSYTVAAYDLTGNVSAQSSSISATTFSAGLSTGPSTPTNIQAVTNSSAQEQPPIVRYYMTFNYTLQSNTQSFNIYRKRPSDSAFVKDTYSAQTPVNPSILPIPGSNESTLYHRGTNQWEWWTTLPAPAPDSAVGEYKFYVTAVDTNSVESVPSETKSFKLYAAPVISSPAEGSTVSSLPTITVSGDPSASSPTYGMVIYKQTIGNTAWSAWPAPSTSFTYPGPALNPNDNPHRLVVWFSSGIYDRSFFATSIFNVSTATTSFNSRAQNLASISQTLNEVKGKLLKLLQGL